MRNGNIFKRSFTNQGIGYSFNTATKQSLFKIGFLNLLAVNEEREPSKMISASSDDGLYVLIEANREEVAYYENTVREGVNNKHCQLPIGWRV